MPVKVKVDVFALHRLQQNPVPVLRALDMPCRDTVRTAITYSQFLVPRQEPWERYTDASKDVEDALADTAFISGPEFNLSRHLSTTWTAGYEHERAGAIHEGFHYGPQIFKPPPHFLRKSFRRARSVARKGVARVIKTYLAKTFPSR
ncbi:hypothetical protein [Myxococcus landrumensis]|uniref:Uncharacterized protein n=1 Tax=Myxococcus landrumensis TaxID=2813577 RepID=A0ABX7NEJ2_9BACT|nr:hypothetical protein [Myxococcus landrumus]QSQ17235.1 hypothetical protein JY572_14740 [Myxococcus landrumus]